MDAANRTGTLSWLPRPYLGVLLVVALLGPGCASPGPADAPSVIRTASPLAPVAVASPSATPEPLRQWIEWSGIAYAPAVPLSKGERLPVDSIYRVISTDLPLTYDQAAKLARQRDSQAKFVALRIELHTTDLAGVTARGASVAMTGSLIWTSVFFYSPIDDVVLEYQAVFDEKGVYRNLALLPRSSDLFDYFSSAEGGARHAGAPPLRDFKDLPGLREPWAKSNLEVGLSVAWALSGKPLRYQTVITASARVPYDFSIRVFPTLLDSKKDPQLPESRILVVGRDYYREVR